MRVSKSKFEDFGCPRRGYYKHIKKIELIDASDLSLIYGSAIHKGLDVLFSKFTNLDVDPVGLAQDTFDLEFAKYTGPEDPKGQRTQRTGRETMAAFYDQWLNRYPWEDEAGETKYVMAVDSDEFVCVIDRIGYLGGIPTILEFKTTGWPHLFTIDPNIQVESQALTLARNKGEFTYMDVLFILIHVSENAKNGFITPKKAKPGTDLQSIFRALPITLNPTKLSETYADIKARITCMKVAEETGYYHKVTERCGDFGGCPYKRLCVLNPDERGLIEATQYKPIVYKSDEKEVSE